MKREGGVDVKEEMNKINGKKRSVSRQAEVTATAQHFDSYIQHMHAHHTPGRHPRTGHRDQVTVLAESGQVSHPWPGPAPDWRAQQDPLPAPA